MIEDLDAYRDPGAAEDATNNVLYYLVKAGRIWEAACSRYRLRWPTLPAQLARRLCVEGYIELALGRPDLAEVLLSDAAVRFTRLQRFFDAILALLYLAASCCQRADFRSGRDHLTTALHLAQACHHPVVERIEHLIASFEDTNGDSSLAIQQVAFEVGGCLGPSKTEAGGGC